MAVCAGCSQEVADSEAILIRGKDKKSLPVALCVNCAGAAETAFQQETADLNLAGGLLVGLGAGAISAAAWYVVVIITNYQVGFLAIAVGWLVAQGVMLGAGRKRGRELQVASLVITGVAMAAGELLIINHVAIQYLAEQGYRNLPIFIPLEMAWDLLAAGLQDDPKTFLFWGIALWAAFMQPAARRLQRV